LAHYSKNDTDATTINAAATAATPSAPLSSIHQAAAPSERNKSKSLSVPSPPVDNTHPEKIVSQQQQPATKKKSATSPPLPRNKRQLLQLVNKLTLALEKNF
jgi:hypothetical protein